MYLRIYVDESHTDVNKGSKQRKKLLSFFNFYLIYGTVISYIMIILTFQYRTKKFRREFDKFCTLYLHAYFSTVPLVVPSR